MRVRSISDVANCARWVYSPVCVKRESGKSWADIEDCRYINRRIVYQEEDEERLFRKEPLKPSKRRKGRKGREETSSEQIIMRILKNCGLSFVSCPKT